MHTLQELCEQGTLRWGEDPAYFTDKGSWHSYIDTYQSLLDKYKSSIRILDIGIRAGGSLWLWKTYCSQHGIPYTLIGMDIEPTYCNIREFQADINDDPNVQFLWNTDSTLADTYTNITGPFEVIIDDGAHSLESQIAAFGFAWPKLANNGTYIIEDVQGEHLIPIISNYIRAVEPTAIITPHLGFKNNRIDDILIVITKPV